MAFSKEDDPLLPKAPSAPEISRSRPQSFKDGNETYYFKEIQIEDEDPGSHDRTFFHECVTVLALCAVFSLIFIFYPQETSDDISPITGTLDERVARILTETPLIGQIYIVTVCHTQLCLTAHRWTQRSCYLDQIPLQQPHLRGELYEAV